MREIELYARGMRIADSDGNPVPIGARPVVQWREKVGFTVALPSGSFGAGSYKYAFDYDRDFLHSEPCNSGECAVSNGVMTFEVTFNSARQAEATNGRVKPIPFYIQITKDGEDSSAEYILDDSIWAAGCVWDGRIPPAPEAPNYYTKAEVDGIAESKLDKPTEAGQAGNVLKLGEDGESIWGEGGGGASTWGSITGDLSNQTDLADALAGKANLVGGTIPPGELPVSKYNALGAVKVRSDTLEGGLKIQNQFLATAKAANTTIDNRASATGKDNMPIVPANLDYAVRSVLPNVTTIPAATTSYSLLDASATTNNHSWQYFHAPASASTYVFPAVTNTAVAHRIKLTIDFADVQTYSFEDAEGTALTPLFTPSISAGDVYEFDCEYSAVKSQWLIWPHKQGAVSDDYVMQSQVGAANGVAGLDSDGMVTEDELPLNSNLGIIAINYNFKRRLALSLAIASEIMNQTALYKAIPPHEVNSVLKSALVGSKHATLTPEQQATAQTVLGINAPIIGTTAPTTSTVGAVAQLYVDTATSKTYHCTAVTNTGTDESPAWSYTWEDDINAKGGTFTGNVVVKNGSLTSNDNIYHVAIGQGAQANGSSYNIAVGINAKNQAGSSTAVFGVNTTLANASRYNMLVGNAYGCLSFTNSPEIDLTGTINEAIMTIPAATTAYTLTEGVQSHAPSSASTYTLPSIPQRIIADGRYFTRNPSTDGTGYYGWLSGTTNRYTASATPAVGDNTYTNTALTSGAKAITAIDNRTHEIILTVRFSSSVLTYAFEDSDGNPLTPLPLAGTIADGSVVAFRCTWEALLGQWVIMPVMLGTYQEVEP